MLTLKQKVGPSHWCVYVVATLLTVNCSLAPPPPAIDSVEPGECSALVSASITIRGRNFHARVERLDLDHAGESVVDTGFEARLVGGQGSIQLREVVRLDQETLSAVVPAATPPGTYAVEVVDPRANIAGLDEALEVTLPVATVFGGSCLTDVDCADDLCVTTPLCMNGSCVYDDHSVSGVEDDCDGLDNDCDGTVDEDYVVDASCGVGYCRSGNSPSRCDGGVLVACSPGAALSSDDATCDDIDDDCDGSADEDYNPSEDCGVGWCRATNTPSTCSSGIEIACAPGASVPEVPDDGIDQDCSGTDTVTCFVDMDLDGVGSNTTLLADDGDCTDSGEAPTSGDCDDAQATGSTCASGCIAHFADLDGDGFGDPSAPFGVDTCTAPVGFVANDADCADLPGSDPACNGQGGSLCNPGRAGSDTCDGANNDCDGAVDEDPDVVWFEDADSDGYGNLSSTQVACSQPAGFVSNATDCADLPIADPDCNGLAGAECNPGWAGVDGCDGADNDCDASTDEDADLAWFEDLDGDGFGNASTTTFACSQPAGFVADNADCADLPVADPNCNGLAGSFCNPGLVGVDGCDGADNDCDTLVDEDGIPTWYLDDDGDGYGRPDVTQTGCSQPVGFSPFGTDCADTPGSDPACNGLDGAECNPSRAGADLCDGADNDCDGSADEDGLNSWYEDADGDGFGNPLAIMSACAQPAGFVANNTDCADSLGPDPGCNGLDGSLCHPGLAGSDGCDGANNDCDGSLDEDPDTVWYEDADGDAFGLATSAQQSCTQPVGYVADNTDCADVATSDPACNGLSGAACNPGLVGSDGCDGADNDCDGSVDEDPDTDWFVDTDSDGHGSGAVSQTTCTPPAGHALDNLDCDDTTATGSSCWTTCQRGYADTDGDGFGDPFLPDPTTTCVPPPGSVFDSGDCDDLVPSCNIDCATDVDADGNPDCTDTCIGGADCSAGCAAGCCEESCVSNCDFTCNDDACPCYLDCSGSPDVCTATCQSGATCEVDCHGADSCDLQCKNNGTTCDFDCGDVPGTCMASCTSGAPCSIDCTNSAICDLTCQDNNTLCEFDCGGSTTCDVVCKSGAECVVDCNGAATCAFTNCAGGETSCPGDIIVCNRGCP